MNVLSLFDGISCGQLALQRAGVSVEKYFASEIDQNAIKVANHNFPSTIQLGDVSKIKYINGKLYTNDTMVFEGTIDLLIGGSPCQGFSFAGKQLNFNDVRSKLFFEYVRLLKEISPKYFLLENVKMKKEYQKVISNALGVEVTSINSQVLSKQNRPRLYWTNIPIATIVPTDENFNGYLYRLGHGYISDEIKFYEKYPSLVAQSPSTKYRIVTNIDDARKASWSELRKNKTLTRSATPEECEEFQTLPIGYTSVLNKTHRYKAIGNGWTVSVISHILSSLSAKS